MSIKNAQREKFVFFLSYYEAMQSLDDSDKILMYNALCNYAFYGDIPKLSPQLTALFTLMKPYLDKSIRFAEKQSNNRSNPNHTKNNQTSPNKTEKENEEEREYEGEEEKEFDIRKEFKQWTV